MEKIEILKDWGDLLAVFKPAGWLTIPGRNHAAPGLKPKKVLSRLLGEQLRTPQESRDKPDLYIVHRLDEGTSGIVLFAKTAEAHKKISQMFENGEVKKTYWAIVTSTTGFKDQIIDAPLFKLPSKKNKSVVSLTQGKPSQTVVKKIKSLESHSGPERFLIEAIPLTGRSHQIRVHLAHVGFPILNDALYGGAKLNLDSNSPLLHAQKLEFHWSSALQRIECDPPPPMSKFIASE